ncbi:g2642 [Coccomyxa viridis]|uniref:G2642 protein n=1 Tax=Coccomyxa viridis TaxID=1274662 RepID=A0ABP1FMJ3_9CHLO
MPTRGAASIAQLSYSKPDVAHKSVQQHLWTGLKATDLHMPACPQRSAVVAAHQQQLQKEAAESQWATTSRTVAEIASQGAVGGACKREGCRPAAKGGQPAQIGRKAVGECSQLLDKTWMQIGLRK